MTAIQRHELVPGLCAFLDTKILAERADSSFSPNCPSIRVPANISRIPFLILEHVASKTALFCVALSTVRDIDQEPLDDRLKSGGSFRWQSESCFFHTGEGWLIPNDTFMAASHVEMRKVTDRMRYARRSPAEIWRLKQIADARIENYVPVWYEPTKLEKVSRSVAHRPHAAVAFSERWGM